jgi:hypothetical protein
MNSSNLVGRTTRPGPLISMRLCSATVLGYFRITYYKWIMAAVFDTTMVDTMYLLNRICNSLGL